MNKWVSLRDWIEHQLERHGEDISIHCFESILAMMDELNDNEQHHPDSDVDSFEATDEAYKLWIDEQRLKHPQFYKMFDNVDAHKVK